MSFKEFDKNYLDRQPVILSGATICPKGICELLWHHLHVVELRLHTYTPTRPPLRQRPYNLCPCRHQPWQCGEVLLTQGDVSS